MNPPLPDRPLAPPRLLPFTTLVALRQATGTLHAQLERGLRITDPAARREDYRDYLVRLWGWHAAFEDRLWAYPWPAAMQAPLRARKLARLRSDLLAFGIDPWHRALPLARYAPDLEDAATRFGVAYVVEGSQLGVRVLGKTLAPVLAPAIPAWLQGYGEASAEYWKCYVACLEQAVSTDATRARAAAAAAGAFASLVAWMETGSPASPGEAGSV